MNERTRPSWFVYALGVLCVAAVVAAVLVVGPASSSRASVTRTATAAQGVVQSTVSGSGNLESASQLDLGFKTAGTVSAIYVRQGEHVVQGQLLATLDPQSAEVTLEQAKATLQAAEASLAKEEETDGEGSTAGSGGGADTNGGSASTASVPVAVDAAYTPAPTSTGTSTTPPSATTPTETTTPASTTTPSRTTPSTSTSPATRTTPTTTRPQSTEPTSTSKATGSQGTSGTSSSSSQTSTLSAATREANLASARAAVKSDALSVHSDEEAVQDTKLYAPESGTIVSLSGQVGEVVSGAGTTKAASSSSSSSSTGSGATGAGASSAAGARGGTGGSSSASSSAADSGGSSSSSFAVLSDLSSMQLVVPLSEAEISKVQVGQIATVTVEALEGRKLAAHVSEVALISSSSSGAVSYDVTFQLDQLEAGLKLGMSATAEVVVKQEEGVNVPTSAITADTVTVVRDGKDVRQRVTTGLAGNSSTIILSGLKAGEEVLLPSATTSSGTTGASSRFGARGAGGGFAGAAGLGGAGGGAFFRGGG